MIFGSLWNCSGDLLKSSEVFRGSLEMFKNGIGVVRRCHKIYGSGLPLTLVIRLMLKPSSVIIYGFRQA